jgi:hypothetical protein
MALAKAHDANEAGFWQELMGGAKGLWQGQLAQLGLALRWQRDGRIDQALASKSPITDTTLRQLMLQTMAAPATLRANAADASRPDDERNVARFTLLYKGLTRGAYGDVVRDLALVPPDPKADLSAWYGNGLATGSAALHARAMVDGWPPAAGPDRVHAGARTGHARRRVCLGEFYRLNGSTALRSMRRSRRWSSLAGARTSSRSPCRAMRSIQRSLPTRRRPCRLARLCALPRSDVLCAVGLITVAPALRRTMPRCRRSKCPRRSARPGMTS